MPYLVARACRNLDHDSVASSGAPVGRFGASVALHPEDDQPAELGLLSVRGWDHVEIERAGSR